MKDEYVKFGTAKLLKEKRFDWGCCSYWCIFPNGDRVHTDYGHFANHNGNETDKFVSRPTQAVALRWLKEEKGMYISVVPDFNEYGEYPDDLYWFARVYDLKNGDYIHSTKLYIGSQEAFEAALEYCLTNLI